MYAVPMNICTHSRNFCSHADGILILIYWEFPYTELTSANDVRPSSVHCSVCSVCSVCSHCHAEYFLSCNDSWSKPFAVNSWSSFKKRLMVDKLTWNHWAQLQTRQSSKWNCLETLGWSHTAVSCYYTIQYTTLISRLTTQCRCLCMKPVSKIGGCGLGSWKLGIPVTGISRDKKHKKDFMVSSRFTKSIISASYG